MWVDNVSISSWLKNVDKFNVKKFSKDSSKGYILGADLEYFEEFTVYTMIVLSVLKKLKPKKVCYQIITNGKVRKLLHSWSNKGNYVLHYRNLHLYLQLGMKQTNIAQVLVFEQFQWLKPYIDFNTEN